PALMTPAGPPLSYAELERRVGALAERLEAEAAVARRAVAVEAESEAAYLVAVLAAFAADAVVLPVDRTLATPRRDAVLGAVRPALVCGGTLTAPTLEARPDPRRFEGPLADAGLVLATSGSGGVPKRVVLGRAGLQANVDAILGYLPVRAHPRTGLLLPLWYSYGLVGQALVTLRAGGALGLCRGGPFPSSQLEALRAVRAEGLSSVPAQLRRLAQAVLEGEPAPPLAYVASAGASLDPLTARLLREAFPAARRFNQYGLTEASPRVAFLEDASDPAAFGAGAIGRPLPGVEVDVRAGGRLCAPGEEGELVVRGPNVMLAYLDDAEATAAALGPQGLRTGDRGHRDAAGVLHLAGRADDLVKIAGERVSTLAVARALEACPGVDEAAVLALVMEGAPSPRLVAFVAGPVERSALRAHVRELPAAWRPRLERVDALPRTPRGKLDRAALRRLLDARS
ncbi:MAG TPA: fatty acid--CoA ligase family protein, partial [Polyangiaceae bacterium LLY-WYZ-15_(1-7)]|nr:fatty acid--CoA ligase family protein [Polyangiaceae bacterium LLY-WYZ-15_(1-7)]